MFLGKQKGNHAFRGVCMRQEHLIVNCMKCMMIYDMDFEPALDDDHLDAFGDECYSEDWNVTCVPCAEWEDCNCSARVSKGLKADFPDLSAKPL
jgi:hypothetical protein